MGYHQAVPALSNAETASHRGEYHQHHHLGWHRDSLHHYHLCLNRMPLGTGWRIDRSSLSDRRPWDALRRSSNPPARWSCKTTVAIVLTRIGGDRRELSPCLQSSAGRQSATDADMLRLLAAFTIAIALMESVMATDRLLGTGIFTP